MQRIGNLLLILALLASTGSHWALLQSVAWTTMLANHLQSQTLAESVVQTFDGRHLCPLCMAIQAAKKAEKKTEFPVSSQKIEFPPLAAPLVLYAPSNFALMTARDVFSDSPALPPPTPPPRVIPA